MFDKRLLSIPNWSVKEIEMYLHDDFFTGLTCQHVSKAVDLNSVKKSVLSSVWLVCSDCLKERTMIDGEPGASHDIVVCLKCGFQVIIPMLYNKY